MQQMDNRMTEVERKIVQLQKQLSMTNADTNRNVTMLLGLISSLTLDAKDIKAEQMEASERIGGLETRMDAVEQHLSAIDRRLGAVEQQLGDMRTSMESAFSEILSRLPAREHK